MERLVTTYSRVEWSPDGRTVTKTRLPAHDARRRHRYEERVNRMLLRTGVPVRTAALVDSDRHRRAITFEAIDGLPLGPKYPAQLDPATIDAMLDLIAPLRSYRPQRRWLRQFSFSRRLSLAARAALLSGPQGSQLAALTQDLGGRVQFAHGDLTARNVLQSTDGFVLIDWEWAGLYPESYDEAFLWFSLVDVPGGRDQVEAAVQGDPRRFLLCALMIQLWHLQWYVSVPFRPRHLATREELLARLLA